MREEKKENSHTLRSTAMEIGALLPQQSREKPQRRTSVAPPDGGDAREPLLAGVGGAALPRGLPLLLVVQRPLDGVRQRRMDQRGEDAARRCGDAGDGR